MSLHEVAPLATVIERLLDFGPISVGAIKLQITPRRTYALSDIRLASAEGRTYTSCELIHVDDFGSYQPQSHRTYRGWCNKMEVMDLFDKRVGVRTAKAWFLHISVYGTYRSQASFYIGDRLKKRITINELSALPAITRSSRSS